MEIGVVGLGRMGANMARRLARGGHRVVAYNRTPEKALALAAEEPGIQAVTSLPELADALAPPRAVWMMVPAGDATEEMLRLLLEVLAPGDLIVDGGNSNYKDTLRRAEKDLPQRRGHLTKAQGQGIMCHCNTSYIEVKNHAQAHMAAQGPPPVSGARLPGPHADFGRTESAQGPTAQRQEAPDGLKPASADRRTGGDLGGRGKVPPNATEHWGWLSECPVPTGE
jgi:hypothetical protein